MASLRSVYPGAFVKRLPSDDAGIRKMRKAFLQAVGNNFLLLQLLFLGLFCYVFGALFQQMGRTHNLNIVFVDYDGGAIGRAVRSAYASLQGDNFPTLTERAPSDILTPGELWESVCRTEYWAALYVSPGASRRLEDALATNSDNSMSSYDNTDIMAYIWNQALYSPVADGSISANLQLLSNTARIAYTSGNGTGNLSTISGPSALSVLAEPWHLQSLNIQPTTQGSRAIYNNIVIVLVLIQEFFYLGTINGLYAQFKVYSRVRPFRIVVVRNINSTLYTLIGALCVSGTIWAFRSGWDLNGNQFVLAWVIIWLFAHCNFLTLDVFTIWLPQAYVPMALISWVILNITSVLLPFELSPGFYRLGYLFPAHEVYQVLTNIWSRGCNPQLRYALPVLFAWEIVGLALSVLGVFRRCHFATVGEETQAREFREKVDAAVALHLDKMDQGRGRTRGGQEDQKDGGKMRLSGETPSEDEEALQAEMAGVIERIGTRQQMERERTGSCSFGPAFDVPFRYVPNGKGV
ncbi:hypothetical protein QBC34DRAFT_356978 [Podospora aff. communis PSN243]|uniref:DUF3533 domain-containing protein n=1 Tax=Podospora aff. communis PSN243 TaxID=3040156 RepID=A0AAV9GBU0_9PEZI|nr:hypothetical protein QBC34DRAFT_356978 [Podospora aff. communis PSN243]